MALTKQGDFTFNHADQVDRPAYTAAENKAKFDSRANELKATLNGLIDDLEATDDGASGADNIGMTAITETGAAATVQAVVEALIARLKATDDSASGADLIGATTVGSLSGATVQAILEEMDTAIGSAATASALAAHLADTMPHRFTDGENVYKWGFRTVDGQPQFIYEQVVE